MVGDQLIFFYDARANRVPFIGISSLASVTVEIVFYSQDLTRNVSSRVTSIPAAGNVIIDPSTVDGLVGNAGLVVVTPVVSESDLRPVVPEDQGVGPYLMGAFTLANLELGAGFGQSPLARIAVNAQGNRAPEGAIVDGAVVRYQRFAPAALLFPLYFNPQDLSPPEEDGNRIILAAFDDVYGDNGFMITPSTQDLAFSFRDSQGTTVVTNTDFRVTGVRLETIQSLAPGVTLSGSGKIAFGGAGPGGSWNRLGIVSQAVGTFAIGQRMPGLLPETVDDHKIVFVTSASMGSNLGGLAGADSICQGAAEAAGLVGTFRAWLSDRNTSAAERSSHASVPYVRMDGVRVADDWDDLTDGSLQAPILITETGVEKNSEVWTGTDTVGLPASGDCAQWITVPSASTTAVGQSSETGEAWTLTFTQFCDRDNVSLYCLQQ